MFRSSISVIIFSFLFSGCVQQIAVSTVGSIVHDGFGGIMEEDDLIFAGQALPANLKLLEVMLKNDPDNREILLMLSEGYSSYALGFVEDQNRERARAFYLRGRGYGKRILDGHEGLKSALDGPVDSLKAVLRATGDDYLPAVFWTAFGTGSYINLSLSDPDALALIPGTTAMMEYVTETDSGFYYGGADIFLGALFGSRPKILGGDVERARAHFERAIRINRGKFLLTYVYYARSVAVQTRDEELFDDLLHTVDHTPLEILPEMKLPNAIAKEKGKSLREKKEDLF